MDISKLVRVHLKIRDKRSELKRAFEASDADLKAQQARLEAEMLRLLNAAGGNSVNTDEGTIYRQEVVKPSCSDWDAFYRWVAKTNNFEALQKRLTVKFIEDFMEANSGALPPGVNAHREFVARVRRPNAD